MKSWQRPSFVELRMDAEIGSYQDDFERDHEAPAFVVQEEESDAQAPAR